MPEINQCELTGTIVQIDPPRLTPAGVPRCRLWLEHRSRQMENSQPREVNVRLAVQLIGESWGETIKQLQTGEQIRVWGFLSRAGFKGEARERVQLQAQKLERL